MMDQFRDNFREEAYELLNALEDSLMRLEEYPEDSDLIAAVFRSMHTIKGSAAMFGFEQISTFTHEVETVLDLVRNGKLRITKDLTGLTLRARDHIRELLDAGDELPEELVGRSGSIMEEYRAIAAAVVAGESEQPVAARRAARGAAATKEKSRTRRPAESIFRIRLAPRPGLFEDGTNPMLLLRELRQLGDYSCVAYVDKIPGLSSLDPEKCYVSWDIVLTTTQDLNAVKDVFIFVEDNAEIDIQSIEEADLLEGGSHKRLGQILVERGVIDMDRLENVAHKQKRLGQLLVEDAGLDPTDVHAALEEQNHLERARKRAQTELAASSIRVSSEKLDTLVDLVGEMVTLQARLSQTVGSMSAEGALVSISESLERLTAELRDSTMSIRMLPIGTTFSKFRRLVRDLSNDLGKNVVMIAEGGETELDKTVIERLNDPLIHIIRNSIDHGIEVPAERARGGKPEQGTVRLAASHSGASVLISITDDGQGVNLDRVKARAIENGTISKEAQLTDQECMELIFTPGFSTAATVTTVSGRGVGMDVVKKEIESLGGTVRIESHEGVGMTTTLDIPLTLAIIEGLLVDVAGEKYVFPLSAVTECIALDSEMKREQKNRRMIENRGEILPYVSLREVFRTEGDVPEIEQIVVTNVDGRKIGFVVDSVIGDYQTVIKNLGKLYREVEGVSGATILGDGSVALIVDVPHLSQIAVAKETTTGKR